MNIDELAELIVGGESRKAYELLREEYGLMPYENAVRHLLERNAQPWPKIADIDIEAMEARHTAAINYTAIRKSYGAATKGWEKNSRGQRIAPEQPK